MTRFCTECGAELRDGIAFCTNCGAKAEQAKAAPQQMPEMNPAPRPAPQYAPAPQPAAAATTEKAVSTGTYFGLMFLFSLPVLGWLICLIVAFAAKNQNIKHFARAMLIWLVIALVISALLGLAANALIHSATAYVEQAVGEMGGLDGLNGLEGLGELGSMMEEFGSLEDMMGQLEGMVPAQ